jgi:thymidylate synthase
MAWYLTGSDALPFLKRSLDRYDEFSDNKQTLNGAYGERIFGIRPSPQTIFGLSNH